VLYPHLVLRLIHTADWHLGQQLYGVSRDFEHAAFLDWLLDTLETECADALIIAGDIFDSTNPPTSAQRSFNRFLVEARRRRPDIDIVLVAGNHDSPARLAAPLPFLEAIGIHLTAHLPRTADGVIDTDKILVPLHDADGEIAAWCAAVPYLRPADLHGSGDGASDLVGAVEEVYDEVLTSAMQRREPGQALVATGHCYLTGGRTSELSERRILVGGEHALPVDVFPEDIDYAALGHLHLAQRVGGRDMVRYSGSPIPMSLVEGRYTHQVVMVEFDDGNVEITAIPVPRSVEILRVPSTGALAPDELLEALVELELDDLPAEQWPFLEVGVRLDEPRPGLREEVAAVLAGRPVRLLRIGAVAAGSDDALADAEPARELADLKPEEVFAARYRSQFEGDPPEDLRKAFLTLLEEVQGGAS
jgi:DNA repair protein SbcD/Mre11